MVSQAVCAGRREGKKARQDFADDGSGFLCSLERAAGRDKTGEVASSLAD